MKHWIFQGNPNHFLIDQYLRENDKITWSVRQRHLSSAMEVGDEVFIWRSGRKKGTIAGVVGRGVLTERPKEMAIDDAEKHLWLVQPSKNKEQRVPIKVIEKCLGPKEVVKRNWLKEDPILGSMRILKFFSETNYQIGRNEAERLAALVRNTGRDWNREESLAGLWAYAHTKGQAVSRTAGSPVSEVALTIGRAITGVYNKVMNFRSLDPDDPRAGLSGGGKMDEQIWGEFFDLSKGQIRLAELDKEYARLWGKSPSTAKPQIMPTYKDFGDAPNDDPDELQEFARRVRRGQKAFRDSLLAAYGEKCCISGHGPKEVLEAVHIVDHAKSGINELDNGLLMRADLHTLFDDGLLKINPDSMIVEIDQKIKNTPYGKFNGKMLEKRTDGSQVGSKYLKILWDVMNKIKP